MSSVVVLDAGPLGMIAHPKRHPAVSEWYARLLRAGVRSIVPEICDYETRREMIREGLQKALRRLDGLGEVLTYLPITTEAMRRAAVLWAQMRNQGTPTAGDQALDADVILCAMVQLEAERTQREHVVATTNVRHLSRLVPAKLWSGL